MNFVASHTLGCVNGLGCPEVSGQSFPFLVGSPVGFGGAHFLLEQTAHELRDRGVLVCGFPAGPMGDFGVEGDGYVLEHRISVTRFQCRRGQALPPLGGTRDGHKRLEALLWSYKKTDTKMISFRIARIIEGRITRPTWLEVTSLAVIGGLFVLVLLLLY